MVEKIDAQSHEYSLCKLSGGHAFSAAAKTYEAADIVAETTAQELFSRLDIMIRQPKVIVDAGSGSGRNIRSLLKRYPESEVIALEPCAELRSRFSLNLIERLRWRSRLQHLGEHIETLRLNDASVDMVFANQSLQWCDLRQAMTSLRRVLKPGGMLSFSTVGPDSLDQLRQAWQVADTGATGTENRVHRFLDMHDLGDELARCGFRDIVMDMDYLTLTYASASALFDELRASGSRNVRADRPKHLTGKARFQRFVDQLESARNADGRIELTVELIYGQAWVPDAARAAQATGPGSIAVDFGGGGH